MTVKAEGFVWLIVGVFWIIAQIAGAASKKKTAPQRRPIPDHNEPPGEDPFADLMQKLSGVQEFNVPQPSEPVVQKPEPIVSQQAQPAPTIKASPEPEAPASVDIRPTMNSFKTAMPSMKFPSMKLHFQCATHHDRDMDSGKKEGLGDRLGLKDRATLRRAMVSHIILGRPKGWGG
ncbi:MAG: hypothetical protein OEL75_00870 [Kiritimatiellaceae bacterium]|nr:hypothetical protein [Kiritimatiellaceae bacterium]